MKTTLSSIVTSIATMLTAAAAPSLCVETTFTAGNHILSRPTLFIDSGQQGSISSGDQESAYTCALTPTLLHNGTVDIQFVITRRKGDKTEKLAAPRIVVELGKLAKIQSDDLIITAKPSLAK